MAAFGSAVYAAGPYDITYNSVAVGLMVGSSQAPAMEIMAHAQLITNTHKYGRTPIGAIGQGAEAFFSAIMMEYKAGMILACWPFGGTNITNGTIPAMGIDWYEVSAALVLTAQSSTLASTNGPATVTAAKAFLQEDFMTKWNYGPELRETPLRMRLYPESTSNYRFWLNT